jgi:DNA polymerase III epsilon subunit-like protein
MNKIVKFLEFIKEHKLWGKSIKDFLDWIKKKSDKYWILLDTETTGLPGNYEVQLTQIACIVIKYDFNKNKYTEIDSYNKKIKLTDKTLSIMRDIDIIKKVLSFNRYGESGIKFHDEEETLQDFFEFLKPYNDPVLVIQNAEFDMRFLNTRNPIVRFDNEVIDTKQVAQLFYLPCLQKLAESETEFKEIVMKIGRSSRDNGLISSSLSKIGPALNINMSGYHDALVDCRLMIQMFSKMIEFLKENQDVDIVKYQTQRIENIRS